MTAVIDVQGLMKRYGAQLAVDDVGFTVSEGEIFGILGVNGAGKTTTVECLQGLRRPDGGRMRVLGLDPRTDRSRLRLLVGSQLQASALPDRLRVEEAVRLFGDGDRQSADALLDTWKLAGLRRSSFASLSGGQRQRLFIALALLNGPRWCSSMSSPRGSTRLPAATCGTPSVTSATGARRSCWSPISWTRPRRCATGWQ